MTTTDTDALTERLWEAVAEVRDQHPRVFNDAPTDDVVAAVLSVVAEEVRKAKAEALRGAERDLERGWPHKLGIDLPPEDYDHAGDHAMETAQEYLKHLATEYETGDQR